MRQAVTCVVRGGVIVLARVKWLQQIHGNARGKADSHLASNKWGNE